MEYAIQFINTILCSVIDRMSVTKQKKSYYESQTANVVI